MYLYICLELCIIEDESLYKSAYEINVYSILKYSLKKLKSF